MELQNVADNETALEKSVKKNLLLKKPLNKIALKSHNMTVESTTRPSIIILRIFTTLWNGLVCKRRQRLCERKKDA